MKMSLIEIVQDIMSDLNTDEVNSITDTVESMQVAQIVRTTFFEMIGRKVDWPHLRKVSTLENVNDGTKPNYLRIPENVVQLDFLNYDSRKEPTDTVRYEEIKYLYPDEFVKKVNSRNPDNDNVEVVTDFDGIRLNIINDKAPTYWTSFDDEHIVFDSYPSDLNSTLLGSSSQAQMRYTPSWSMVDTHVPDLPIEAFPALLAEAKSTAFYALKQMANEKAEQQSKRQQRMLSQKGWVTKGGIRYANYGRVGAKGRASGGHFGRDD